MLTGTRLSELIASGPLAADRLLRIGAALAETVAAAHARGHVYGALSPATVFVTDSDIVRPLDAAEAPISARRQDDLTALANILYAMACGRSPYAAETAISAGVPSAPASPIEINPRLPSGLVQVIQQGVRPEATRRFHNADEVVAALQEIRRAPGSLESLLPAEHVSSSSRVKPPPRPAPDERTDDDSDDVEELNPWDQPRGLPFGD